MDKILSDFTSLTLPPPFFPFPLFSFLASVSSHLPLFCALIHCLLIHAGDYFSAVLFKLFLSALDNLTAILPVLHNLSSLAWPPPPPPSILSPSPFPLSLSHTCELRCRIAGPRWEHFRNYIISQIFHFSPFLRTRPPGDTKRHGILNLKTK